MGSESDTRSKLQLTDCGWTSVCLALTPSWVAQESHSHNAVKTEKHKLQWTHRGAREEESWLTSVRKLTGRQMVVLIPRWPLVTVWQVINSGTPLPRSQKPPSCIRWNMWRSKWLSWAVWLRHNKIQASNRKKHKLLIELEIHSYHSKWAMVFGNREAGWVFSAVLPPKLWVPEILLKKLKGSWSSTYSVFPL